MARDKFCSVRMKRGWFWQLKLVLRHNTQFCCSQIDYNIIRNSGRKIYIQRWKCICKICCIMYHLQLTQAGRIALPYYWIPFFLLGCRWPSFVLWLWRTVWYRVRDDSMWIFSDVQYPDFYQINKLNY